MGKAPAFEPLIESIHDAAGAPGLSPGVTPALPDFTGFLGASLFIEEAALAHRADQRGERS